MGGNMSEPEQSSIPHPSPTKPAKRIRRKRQSSSSKKVADASKYVWQYQHNGRYSNMDDVTSSKLEQAHISGNQQVVLSIGQWTYTFDVHNMSQINQSTTVVRPIRRVKTTSSKVKKASRRVKPKAQHFHSHVFGLQQESDEAVEVITVTNEEKEEDSRADIWVSVELTEELLKNEEQCRLCLCDFEKEDKIGKLSKCNGHFYHEDCGLGKTIVDFIHEKKKCPLCSQFYGVLKGNQPAGRMEIRKYDQAIPGFDDTDQSIEINFYMNGGIQEETHPSPGTAYQAESRVAYLPDNKRGKQVLELFRKGWKQRVLFTVGYSETRQQDHVIIYAGVHMKTPPGHGSHGYPDDKYLDRVTDEFAAKGIVIAEPPPPGASSSADVTATETSVGSEDCEELDD